MLYSCSGEQFKFEGPPHSPESLAMRDFSASALSSRTGDWDSKFEDIQVDEAESTLREALSLNYEEARALLGRLEFQRGNFEAALQVFQGIEIRNLTPGMAKAIVERTRQRKPRTKGNNVVLPSVMSMHSVSLLIEAILLKARSLGELGRYIGMPFQDCIDELRGGTFLLFVILPLEKNEVALNVLKKVAGCSEAKNKPHFCSFLLGAKLCSQDPIHTDEGIGFSRKAIDLANHQCEHFMGQCHKYLGVCYGGAARASVSDSERMSFQRESLNSLNYAALNRKEDPEVMFSLGLENAVQRNLDAAFKNAMKYSDLVAGCSGQSWKLLALIVSAEQCFKDAETIVDFALDEARRVDQLEPRRLKAVLQVAQEQPKQAIETYRMLLTLVQAQRDKKTKNSEQEKTFDSEAFVERNLEKEAWRDLAAVYTKLGLWSDAEICVNKAKLIDFYSAHGWHTTVLASSYQMHNSNSSANLLFEAQSQYKEALISFSVALSIEPDHVPSIVSTAEVLMKLGIQSLTMVRSFLMNALRLEPTNHRAWLNLGLILKKEGSIQQAATFFKLRMRFSSQLQFEALCNSERSLVIRKITGY
ncbi:tetratricopeptide repeat protein 7A-like [Pyrus ussuriensis x Pyrus communis]|uniref:Tetratricopeptide repeat protein 7A-like n=1 Tax=Pyrus ussuriensis x Pyrus communis TaxID=2448454 RepID=A0A5N5HSP7_9ROSA|nr:tetratricopeptide repeat protein 7A-like [Pyrus ussuriensis x Pyrus communis]